VITDRHTQRQTDTQTNAGKSILHRFPGENDDYDDGDNHEATTVVGGGWWRCCIRGANLQSTLGWSASSVERNERQQSREPLGVLWRVGEHLPISRSDRKRQNDGGRFDVPASKRVVWYINHINNVVNTPHPKRVQYRLNSSTKPVRIIVSNNIGVRVMQGDMATRKYAAEYSLCERTYTTVYTGVNTWHVTSLSIT